MKYWVLIDGSDFRQLGIVEAGADLELGAAYSFVDLAPSFSRNFYRLKLIDLDGSFEWSSTISVESESAGINAEIYPNPVEDRLRIELPGRESISVEVISLTGRRRLVQEISSRGEIDLSKLESGIYFLKLSGNARIDYRTIFKK